MYRLATYCFIILVAFFSGSIFFFGNSAQAQDNGKLAFTYGRNIDFTAIYTVNTDGTSPTMLTTDSAGGRYPSWSPDGTKIAFVSNRNGENKFDLYVMNADGSNPYALTDTPFGTNYDQPAWSPDGTKIAIIKYEAGGSGILIINIADGSQVRLTGPSQLQDGDPRWSPDSTKIAFSSQRDNNRDIYVINAGGGNPIRLTTAAQDDITPSWSPDGYHIAFSSQRDGKNQIYVMNSDGTRQTNISNSNTTSDYYPSWSPDGTKIAYTRIGNNFNSLREIYVMEASGANQTKVFGNGIADSFAPVWQPLNGSASPSPSPAPVPVFSVSGRAMDNSRFNPINGSAPGVGGITIALTGAQSATTKTDANGYFFFGNLKENSTFTLTPQTTDWGVYPTSQSFTTSSQAPNATNRQVSVSFQLSPIYLEFTDNNYTVSENAGQAVIYVSRSGYITGASTIDYATSDGTAMAGSDYVATAGTLRFAPGESMKSFVVPILSDAITESDETINLTLSNPTGSTSRGRTAATLTVLNSNNNPIDDPRTFVRQQYLDFLNREPDQGGWDYWSSLITNCNGDPQCINTRRVSVSAAFFIEQEFQLTGNYVYRMYKAAYGQRPSYAQFLPDRARINPDVAQIEASKQQFADLFVQRPEFLARYPSTMTPDAFIDALIATVKTETGGAVDLTSQRAALLSTLQASGRATVVRQAAENTAFQSAEYNKAFVTMQYFGYLRRDPEDGGYNFWLDVLNNRVQNNYRGMVCAFITSAEYQLRFSSVVTRNDSICGNIGP